MNHALTHVHDSSRGSSCPIARAGTCALAATAVSLVLVSLHGRLTFAQTPKEGPSINRDASPTKLPNQDFFRAMERNLKSHDVRLIALARSVLDDPAVSATLEDELDRLRFDMARAEGAYQSATLKREIAEIALREYVEGSFPQELAVAEGELNIAQAALAQAKDMAAQARDHLEKLTAGLQEKRASFVLEQAESKKKVLVEYTKSQHTKGIESQLEGARSDERNKKAQWELLKSRIEKMQKAAASPPRRIDAEKRILALLDRAVLIEEQAQAKLQRLRKRHQPDDAASKEICEMIDELGAIIDEAEAAKSADDLARLKAQLQSEAPSARINRPSATPQRRAFIREIHRSLKANDDRLSALAKQRLEVRADGRYGGDDLVNMRIEQKSAEAAYENAKLSREVAEIAVIEYKEGILVQGQATLDGEIKLAERDLGRARDIAEHAVKIGAADVDMLTTRLEEKGKALLLEVAQRKKKELLQYTAPRRIKEIESEVVQARSDEEAKRRQSERLKSRIRKIEHALATGGQPARDEERSRVLLSRAISLEEQVRAKLDEFIKQANSNDALQSEIRKLANELEATVDEAVALKAAADFAAISKRIREAAVRERAAVSK
jgi:hypothetical protein